MELERASHLKRKRLPTRAREIGRRICALREHYTLNQDEFSKRMLVSRNYLSELENGKRMPTGPLLVALETLFMANKEWVLTGKGGMIADTENREGRSLDPAGGAADVVDLLKGYRALSIENRKKLMNILKVFRIVEEKEGIA